MKIRLSKVQIKTRFQFETNQINYCHWLIIVKCESQIKIYQIRIKITSIQNKSMN